MPRITIGLPVGKAKAQKAQKTIEVKFPQENVTDKVTVTVTAKRYYGNICGWNMKVTQDTTVLMEKFFNGTGEKPIFDKHEALEYAIKKFKVFLKDTGWAL
jgi:hypothetical protein